MSNTAFAAFTIGKDMKLEIALRNALSGAGPLAAGLTAVLDASDLGYLQNFKATPMHARVEIKPISHGGIKRFRDHWDHWQGSFEIVRTGSITDFLIQTLQDSLVNPNGGSPIVDLTQTIIDPSGTNPLSDVIWLFKDCVLSPTDGGTYQADSAVVYGFDFVCPLRTVGTTIADSFSNATGGVSTLGGIAAIVNAINPVG